MGTMNRQLLDSQWPIPCMTLAQALTTIQTMADHSQKWHDGSSSSNVDSSSNTKGITAISHGALDLGSQGVFFIVFVLNGIEKEQQQHQVLNGVKKT
ncbi:hypothetical protein Tco_0345664 [Tanacetum coccineum]